MSAVPLILSIIFILVAITLIVIYFAMNSGKKKPEDIIPEEDKITPDLEPSILVNFSNDTDFKGHKFLKIIARRPVKNGLFLYMKPSDWGSKKYNPNETIVKLCDPNKNAWDLGKGFSPFQDTVFYVPDDISEINEAVLRTPPGKIIHIALSKMNNAEMKCVAYEETIDKMKDSISMIARSVDDNELREKLIQIQNMTSPPADKEEKA